jgi:hypothetical protein
METNNNISNKDLFCYSFCSNICLDSKYVQRLVLYIMSQQTKAFIKKSDFGDALDRPDFSLNKRNDNLSVNRFTLGRSTSDTQISGSKRIANKKRSNNYKNNNAETNEQYIDPKNLDFAEGLTFSEKRAIQFIDDIQKKYKIDSLQGETRDFDENIRASEGDNSIKSTLDLSKKRKRSDDENDDDDYNQMYNSNYVSPTNNNNNTLRPSKKVHHISFSENRTSLQEFSKKSISLLYGMKNSPYLITEVGLFFVNFLLVPSRISITSSQWSVGKSSPTIQQNGLPASHIWINLKSHGYFSFPKSLISDSIELTFSLLEIIKNKGFNKVERPFVGTKVKFTECIADNIMNELMDGYFYCITYFAFLFSELQKTHMRILVKTDAIKRATEKVDALSKIKSPSMRNNLVSNNINALETELDKERQYEAIIQKWIHQATMYVIAISRKMNDLSVDDFTSLFHDADDVILEASEGNSLKHNVKLLSLWLYQHKDNLIASCDSFLDHWRDYEKIVIQKYERIRSLCGVNVTDDGDE